MPRVDGRPAASERIASPRNHTTRAEAEAAVEHARVLASLGCPVFVARPALDRRTGAWDPGWGHGGSGYWLPEGWEGSEADPAALDAWRFGDALGMVTGHALDVLDVDPRNGGDADLAELGRLGLTPTAYAKAATPSGGLHLFTAPHGVRKTKRGGLDLQAGDAEGQGRGFVWIAPTVRRSKVDGQVRPYTWTTPPSGSPVGRSDDRATARVEWFHAAPEGEQASTPERPWQGPSEAWLDARRGRRLSAEVWGEVLPYYEGAPLRGHHRMLKLQARLVLLGSEGHGGVPEALELARAAWMATPHGPGDDPAEEWDVALARAVARYGGSEGQEGRSW